MWTVLAVGRTILCVVFASGAVFARSMPCLCLEFACRAHGAVLNSPCRIDGFASWAGRTYLVFLHSLVAAQTRCAIIPILVRVHLRTVPKRHCEIAGSWVASRILRASNGPLDATPTTASSRAIPACFTAETPFAVIPLRLGAFRLSLCTLPVLLAVVAGSTVVSMTVERSSRTHEQRHDGPRYGHGHSR